MGSRCNTAPHHSCSFGKVLHLLLSIFRIHHCRHLAKSATPRCEQPDLAAPGSPNTGSASKSRRGGCQKKKNKSGTTPLLLTLLFWQRRGGCAGTAGDISAAFSFGFGPRANTGNGRSEQRRERQWGQSRGESGPRGGAVVRMERGGVPALRWLLLAVALPARGGECCGDGR